MDFSAINQAALNNFEGLLREWLPGGKREGSEYKSLNPVRADSKVGSFSINIRKGVWQDFATGDKGSDPISLYAYLFHNDDQGKAARELGDRLHVSSSYSPTASTSTSSDKDKAQWQPILPVPADAGEPPAAHVKRGKPEKTWCYRGMNGVLLGYVYRFKTSDGGKEVLPLSWCRHESRRAEWRWMSFPEPRPLYRLNALSTHTDATVILVEGEKCADAAAAEIECDELTVLSWPGGGKADGKVDWTPLYGRKVILWPDCDSQREKVSREEKESGVDPSSKPYLPKEKQPGFSTMTRIGARLMDAGCKVWDVQIEAPGEKPDGWDVADLIESGVKGEELREYVRAKSVLRSLTQKEGGADSIGKTESVSSHVKPSFSVNDTGVYFNGVSKEGDPLPPRWISSPIEILAMARDPHGSGWGLFVSFPDPDGTLHTLIIPMGLFRGDGLEVAGLLLDSGVRIAPKGRQLLIEYLQTARTPKRARVTKRTGWHDIEDLPVFVLPDGSIGSNSEHWIFESESHLINSFKVRGSLAAWKKEISSYAAGNSRLVFSISIAFAAPILGIVGAEGGGFHFRDNSSSGKTTALRIAASVCGGPDFMQRWRATDNGLEALAAQHCDAPLLLDELAQVDPRAAGEVAYMLANGSGKNRANRGGGSRDRQTWRLLFLSAGEIGLGQHMAEAGKQSRAGQELRLAEIPADAGAGFGIFENLHGSINGNEFSKLITQACRSNYGHPFIEFLKKLVTNLDGARDNIQLGLKAFEKAHIPSDSSGQVFRVGARFALVGVAGELATNWGITGWRSGEAMSAAAKCFSAWIKNRGGSGNAEERSMMRQVREFLERHGEARFADWGRPVSDDDHAPRVINKAGWRKHDGAGEEAKVDFFIYPEVFRNEVCKGFDAKAVAALLSNKGFLRSEKGGRLDPKVTLPGEGSRRVFHVLSAIWGDTDD